MRPTAALALASLLPLTSGCVAAAIPLVAGAALVKGRGGPQAAPAPPASAPAPAPSPGVAEASARSDLKVVRTSLTALPAPDGAAGGADASVLAFRSYALSRASTPPGSGGRPSAIVTNGSALRAVRSDCGVLPAAVFVDLDPGRATFDPLAPGVATPALGLALAALRGSGVVVVWFSRLGANFAAAARTALAQGGLDPTGTDELVLMADIGERKQSLRDAVAQRVCPIAILGDERADFDELYLYLRNPDAALALDALIGNGWFLASPFTPAPSQAATP